VFKHSDHPPVLPLLAFFSISRRHGASNKLPYNPEHHDTESEYLVPRHHVNTYFSSNFCYSAQYFEVLRRQLLPNTHLAIANTPIGNVNPHHPILNGNLLLDIDATARNNHTSPKPHSTRATMQPSTYKISPAMGLKLLVSTKAFRATLLSCMIPYPP
jgi:hypothetical protein